MTPSAATATRTDPARAPAELDTPDTPEALTEALTDPDLDVRAAAGLALAGLRDPATIVALAGIVAGWDAPELARARRAALHALIAFRDEAAAVELARALATRIQPPPLGLEDRSALLAVTYAEKAGRAGPRVVRALVVLLAHDEQTVAERAASLLMLFPTESHGPLVRWLRTAAAPEIRRRAAHALGACRQDVVVAALVTALNDPASSVRAAAARSLGNVRDPATALALQAAGQDRDERVREAARTALVKLGPLGGATQPAVGFAALARGSPG